MHLITIYTYIYAHDALNNLLYYIHKSIGEYVDDEA